MLLQAFIIKQGMTLAGTLQAAGEPLAPFIEIKVSEVRHSWNHTDFVRVKGSQTIANDAVTVIYSDLPAKDAKIWADQLKPLALK